MENFQCPYCHSDVPNGAYICKGCRAFVSYYETTWQYSFIPQAASVAKGAAKVVGFITIVSSFFVNLLFPVSYAWLIILITGGVFTGAFFWLSRFYLVEENFNFFKPRSVPQFSLVLQPSPRK